MIKTRTALAAAAVAALLATPLVAQTSKKDQASSKIDAKEFVQKAASGGMFEVESSRMAADKAKRQEVKTFADQMVTDHTKANKELESIASKAGVTVPKEMNQSHQAMMKKLQGENSSSFDNAYVNAQVEAHREAVSLFSTYSKDGDNADLKSFAAKTLPTLEKHQTMVRDLDKNGAAATGTSSGSSGKKK